VESEFFIQSLGFSLSSLVKIKNLPHLIVLTRVVFKIYIFTFFVFAVSYTKNFVISPVDELTLLVLEDLEPS
jgi:hypothetical protein